MKISEFDDLKVHVSNYRKIKDQIKIVRDSNALGVTIQGSYQDEELLKDVRPVVVSALESKLHKIKHALIGLGVFEFDDEQESAQ